MAGKRVRIAGTPACIQFRVPLNRPLTKAAKKTVSAKSKVIKQSNIIGLLEKDR